MSSLQSPNVKFRTTGAFLEKAINLLGLFSEELLARIESGGINFLFHRKSRVVTIRGHISRFDLIDAKAFEAGSFRSFYACLLRDNFRQVFKQLDEDKAFKDTLDILISPEKVTISAEMEHLKQLPASRFLASFPNGQDFDTKLWELTIPLDHLILFRCKLSVLAGLFGKTKEEYIGLSLEQGGIYFKTSGKSSAIEVSTLDIKTGKDQVFVIFYKTGNIALFLEKALYWGGTAELEVRIFEDGMLGITHQLAGATGDSFVQFFHVSGEISNK